MSPDGAELFAKLMAFDIDGADVPQPFAVRLARENGWSVAFARRAVAEYKRFVFLAVTGSAPVCPSEAVDAVWHLHLTYTRSYWHRFCGELLGKPLHHDPTQGGAAEGAKHVAMYETTLARYRATFGEAPPVDVWPNAEQRFGEDARHRAVNTVRNWVIPKAPVRRAAGLTAAAVLVAAVAPGCRGDLDPFALKNNDFLLLVFVCLVCATIGGRILRRANRSPDPQPGDESLQLNWEQTAYLAGGADRLSTAALARLAGRGLAQVSDSGTALVAVGPEPADLSAVERAALHALPANNTPGGLKAVRDAVAAAFAEEVQRFESEGYQLTTVRQVGIGCGSLIPLLLVVLLLSVPRVVSGIANGHPVLFLVALSFFGLLIGTAVIATGVPLRLTNRGIALLAKQKERHTALRASLTDAADAGMAVALFGTAALAGTALVALQTWYPRQTAEASDGGCSTLSGSGCGTSDGSSGGDGGSGCGGGCGGGGD